MICSLTFAFSIFYIRFCELLLKSRYRLDQKLQSFQFNNYFDVPEKKVADILLMHHISSEMIQFLVDCFCRLSEDNNETIQFQQLINYVCNSLEIVTRFVRFVHFLCESVLDTFDINWGCFDYFHHRNVFVDQSTSNYLYIYDAFLGLDCFFTFVM